MEQQPSSGIVQRWGELSQAQRITVVALGVMTLSQFMTYIAPHTVRAQIELQGVYTINATSSFGVNQAVAGQSGWSLHPHAWLVLGALLALFILQINLGEGWRRWRYWIAVAGMVACFLPFDLESPPGWGALVGVVAIAIGVWAARIARRPAAAG